MGSQWLCLGPGWNRMWGPRPGPPQPSGTVRYPAPMGSRLSSRVPCLPWSPTPPQQGWEAHAVNQLKAEMRADSHPQWKTRWGRASFSTAAITNDHPFTGLKQNGCISLQFTVVGSPVGSEAESTFLAHSGCWQNPVPRDGRTEASFPCWLSARPEAASSISKASSAWLSLPLASFCLFSVLLIL